jgi:hypothetical protein
MVPQCSAAQARGARIAPPAAACRAEAHEQARSGGAPHARAPAPRGAPAPRAPRAGAGCSTTRGAARTWRCASAAGSIQLEGPGGFGSGGDAGGNGNAGGRGGRGRGGGGGGFNWNPSNGLLLLAATFIAGALSLICCVVL